MTVVLLPFLAVGTRLVILRLKFSVLLYRANESYCMRY